MIFTRKPLQTSGAPQKQGPDPKAIFLHGRMVQVDKMMRDAAVDELTSVVPGTWEVVQQSASGEMQTLVKGAVAFAVADDGTLFYSTGRGVFQRSRDGGKPLRISSRPYVTSIFLMKTPAA